MAVKKAVASSGRGAAKASTGTAKGKATVKGKTPAKGKSPAKGKATAKAPATSARSAKATGKTPAKSAKTPARAATSRSATKAPVKKTATTAVKPKAATTKSGGTTTTKATTTKATTTKAPATKAAKAPTKTAATKAPAKAAKPPTKRVAGPYASDAKFLGEQKALLLEERSVYEGQALDLRAEADSLALEREPGDVQFDEESGEGGTVTVDRERNLALSAQAGLAVEEIDDALRKIARKSYGACERCHQPIPKARLRALPYARLCVACKSGGLSRR